MIPLALLAAFALTGVDGAKTSFDPSRSPATVLVFVSTVCPVAADYADRVAALHGEFALRGIPVLVIYPNRTESAEEIRRHVRAVEWTFPVYRDEGNAVADLVQATVTPSVFVLDRTGKVRYGGAVDDAVNRARVKRSYAREAVEAVLAGRDPDPPRAKGFG